jgi:NurA-like 5'-3' nuclease
MKRNLRIVRKDEWFHETYQRTLRDIEERLSKIPLEKRYEEAYKVLRSFLETLLNASKEQLTIDQQVETWMILTALDIVTGNNKEQNIR